MHQYISLNGVQFYKGTGAFDLVSFMKRRHVTQLIEEKATKKLKFQGSTNLGLDDNRAHDWQLARMMLNHFDDDYNDADGDYDKCNDTADDYGDVYDGYKNADDD